MAFMQFAGDIDNPPAAAHGGAAEPFVGVRFAQAALLDQHRLGPVDDRPFAQAALGQLQIILRLLMPAEQGHGGAQDRFDVRGRHADRIVGGNPGTDRLLHERRVVFIHEQDHRPRIQGGNLPDAIERVAIRTRHVHEHHVRGQRGDRIGQRFVRLQAHNGQPGVGGQDARDRTGPLRIVVGQQDFHVCGSLLRMGTPNAKPMPHRNMADCPRRRPGVPRLIA